MTLLLAIYKLVFNMLQSIFLLTIVVFAHVDGYTYRKSFNPVDLEDEARALLEKLNSTVLGIINAGYIDMDFSVTEVNQHRDNVFNTATLMIEQEYQILTQQVTVLKELAQSANQNIDICLVNEPYLDRLPQAYIDTLKQCLAYSDSEISTIQKDAIYYINIVINEVNRFEFDLNICAGDMLCISPIITKMDIALIQLPIQIELEVGKARELCEDLKTAVEGCAQSKVAQFVSAGGTVVDDMTTCVDQLLA